jgi:hypothetical protein
LTRHLTTDPWRPVTGLRQLLLLKTLLRYTLRHLFLHPYHDGRPKRKHHSFLAGLRSRAGSAVYDCVINHFIKGYTELTGVQPRPETGALVILLYRLMAAFDDEYERRVHTHEVMAFTDILHSEPVQKHLDSLSAFLVDFDERVAIREFLEEYATANYDKYLALNRSRETAQNFSRQLEMIQLDSGGFLVCTVHVIAIFNNRTVNDDVVDEFRRLGIIGKLADDMVDVWEDHDEGVVNVLAGVVASTPGEAHVLATGSRRRTSHRWWRNRCPASFAHYSRIVARHRSTLTSRSLGVAGDLMLLPAAWGGPKTRPSRTSRSEVAS